MNMLRNLVVAALSVALLVGMLMAGAFVLLGGLAVGLVALGWYRLKGGRIVNPAEDFGREPERPLPPTIEADYEVVEETIRFEEKDRV